MYVIFTVTVTASRITAIIHFTVTRAVSTIAEELLVCFTPCGRLSCYPLVTERAFVSYRMHA